MPLAYIRFLSLCQFLSCFGLLFETILLCRSQAIKVKIYDLCAVGECAVYSMSSYHFNMCLCLCVCISMCFSLRGYFKPNGTHSLYLFLSSSLPLCVSLPLFVCASSNANTSNVHLYTDNVQFCLRGQLKL